MATANSPQNHRVTSKMESRSLKAFILLFVAFLCHSFRPTNSEIVSCDNNDTCGFNSLCISNECVCNEGFTSLVHPAGKKGKNCIDMKCGNGKCYICLDAIRCKKCKKGHYVTEGTGKCTDKCKTQIVWMNTKEYEGDVCEAPEDSKWTKEQYIGLIVGLCLAAILIIVVGIVIVIIRKKKIDEDTNRQIEEIKARKKKEREERRKARNAAKNSNAPEEKQGATPAVPGHESPGNVRGAKDFEV